MTYTPPRITELGSVHALTLKGKIPGPGDGRSNDNNQPPIPGGGGGGGMS